MATLCVQSSLAYTIYGPKMVSEEGLYGSILWSEYLKYTPKWITDWSENLKFTPKWITDQSENLKFTPKWITDRSVNLKFTPKWIAS